MAHPPLGENLTYKDVAAILGVTERHVRNLRASGELAAYRIGRGRTIRFRRSDVDALFNRIPTTDPTAR